MNVPLTAVRELVSSAQKNGRPVVRLTCSDYGTEWVVAADVYPVDEPSVEAKSAGSYVFGSAQEARRFVESSLIALRVLG